LHCLSLLRDLILELRRPFDVTLKLTDRLLEKDARINVIVFGELVALENDIIRRD
jgi:hypothetical protein